MLSPELLLSVKNYGNYYSEMMQVTDHLVEKIEGNVSVSEIVDIAYVPFVGHSNRKEVTKTKNFRSALSKHRNIKAGLG